MMTWPEDKAAHLRTCQVVVDWIREALGDEAASTWLWECTPFPCWSPSSEQLDEGLRIATGEMSLRDHLERCYAEMDRQSSDDRSEDHG